MKGIRHSISYISSSPGEVGLPTLPDYEAGVMYCQSGIAKIKVDSVLRELNAGDLLIIVPFKKAVFEMTSVNFKAVFCSVDIEFAISAVMPLSWSTNLLLIARHPVVAISPEDARRLLNIIHDIEIRQNDLVNPVVRLMTECFWKALAYQIIEAYTAVHRIEVENASTRDVLLITFQAQIRRDFLIHREVAYYAALQNLTPAYFGQAIKEATGHSPNYWINQAVVGEAKRLMLSTNKSIKEIGFALNFSSATFFSRWFRQNAGETPAEFRSRHRHP